MFPIPLREHFYRSKIKISCLAFEIYYAYLQKNFIMSKAFPLVIIIISLLSSCSSFKSLHSTTYIKANDTFVLGNNEHGKFYVQVTNTSNQEITVWQYPISGGKHSPLVLKGKESSKINVDKNTSLQFENSNASEVAIKLKVKGDLGLSMGYKN